MKSKFIKLIFILYSSGILLNGCNHRTGLEGTWVGFDIQKPRIDWTLTILDNHFYLVREDLSMWYVGKFNLNNNCILRKIDLKFSQTHIQVNNGTELLGIYEIDGNTLTLITSRPGNQLRPDSLDANNDAVVFSFVRS